MTKMSERETLAAKYVSMAANGLVDVKYFLGNAGEATTEQICREVNAMYVALERGDFEPLEFSDHAIK